MGMRFLALILLAACASQRHIDVPAHLRADDSPQKAPSNYVVKLTENGREWNVWLPPVSGGYEVRIPLAAGEALPQAGLAKKMDEDSPEFRAALVRVNSFFARKSYDLALIELAKLRQLAPQNAKLLAMQGTLEWKLGNKDKAQAAWEKAMELDPENDTILQMLEGLK